MSDTNTNTSSVNGNGYSEASTILGPVFMLPKAGVIRPGIKTLKSGCSADDKKLYDRMLSEGATWSEINRSLGKDSNGRSKLKPSNVDYFTIRKEDCKNPDDAQRLHGLYADADGKIRSLPVWFIQNEWYNIIPHGLRAFGQGGKLRYYSEFEDETDTKGKVTAIKRICRYPVNITPGTRLFGGKRYGKRPCDPENCAEYQSKECTFGGVIQCYIPGVKGIGAWLIPTTSFYSLADIKTNLEMVSSLTKGKLSGMVEPDPNDSAKVITLFTLRKVPDVPVSMVDMKSGNSKKVEQDLIQLDVNIDLTMLALRYNTQNVLSQGDNAIGLLNGPKNDAFKSKAPSQEESGENSDVPEELTNNNSDDFLSSSPVKTESSDNLKQETQPLAESQTQEKKLAPNAEKFYDMLFQMLGSNRDTIKSRLKGLTGKESFFDLSDNDALEAIKKLSLPQSGESTTNSELPEEVGHLKTMLTQMYGNGGNTKVIEELKKLTGVETFEKVTKAIAEKALEKLTESTMKDF